MGIFLKLLLLPFKLLLWVVTLPLRLAVNSLKLLVAVLLVALIIAGVQIVLFQQFFGD